MQKTTDSAWKTKMKNKFYEDLFSKEGYYNSVLLTKEKYDSIIKDIKRIKTFKKHESTRDYLLIERYDVLTIQGREKLINPKTEGDKNPKVYVHSDELFDILYTTHTSIGHGGRDKMLKLLRANYKNITRAQLKIFLDLCESCHPKNNKKGHNRTSNFNNLCQVYYIDFQCQPDDKFKFVLVLQDETTQFVVLKPLTSICAKEITYKLIDIFLMLGAPSNLYLDNENKVCNEIMDTLRPMWPEIKMFQGKPKKVRSEDTDNQKGNLNIEKLVINWMADNKTAKWSEGLRFVQFMKNRAHHLKIEKSPYEAVFGSRSKIGLALKRLPEGMLQDRAEPEIEQNSLMVMIKNEPTGSMESLESLIQDPLTEDENLFDSYKASFENVEAIMDDIELPTNSKKAISQIEKELLKRPGEWESKDTIKQAKKS